MGGTIWVDGEPGRGSTFHFTILAQTAQAPPRPLQGGVQPSLAGKRVLLVDSDHATNLEILKRQTESWGMLAQTSSVPSEAGADPGGEQFDVALSRSADARARRPGART